MSEQTPIPIEREVIPIPADQVTPQMRANAMFSPDNVHPGAFRVSETVSQPEQQPGTSTEAAGSLAVGSAVEQPESNRFDAMFGPVDGKSFNPEDAAVRPEKAPLTDADKVKIKTEQQMAVSAADRKLREKAGLPPRTYDLR